ncbi:MAG TPA: hypothetical protein DEB48_06890 [Verrucomicrobiales bacterium]|nr:hypothetical protein [Verrucomicrobiales bacterium]
MDKLHAILIEYFLKTAFFEGRIIVINLCHNWHESCKMTANLGSMALLRAFYVASTKSNNPQ